MKLRNSNILILGGSSGIGKACNGTLDVGFRGKYGHFGIIINGIAPGATLTPMISSYAHDISEKYERHAIERFIKPEEIAKISVLPFKRLR